MPDSSPQNPVLSAILPTWDTMGAVAITLAHLQRQSIAAHMEVVIVCPDVELLGLQEKDLAPFMAWRVVETGPFESRSQAFAAGVLAARGEFTVFCEDHCFPAAGWAEALVKRHREGDYAAVGPTFENANRENAISDSDLLMAYGNFLQGLPGGEKFCLPGHNSCYQREMLLKEGDGLPKALESEYLLHGRYAREGNKLYLEPEARVYHMNFATWSSVTKASYLAAKVLGSQRAIAWPAAMRILFFFAWPAVPFLRLRRIWPLARQAGWASGRLTAVLPSLFVSLIASAFGEWIGNLFGRRCRTSAVVQYEFHRDRFSPRYSGGKHRDELVF